MLPIVCRGWGGVIYRGRLSRLIRPASPLRSFPARPGAVPRRTRCAPDWWEGMGSNPGLPPHGCGRPGSVLTQEHHCHVREHGGIPPRAPALAHSCPPLGANTGCSWALSYCVTCISPHSPARGSPGLCSAHAELLYGHCKLQPSFLPELSASRLLGALPISGTFLLFLNNSLLLLKHEARACAWLGSALRLPAGGGMGTSVPTTHPPLALFPMATVHQVPHGPGTAAAKSPGRSARSTGLIPRLFQIPVTYTPRTSDF